MSRYPVNVTVYEQPLGRLARTLAWGLLLLLSLRISWLIRRLLAPLLPQVLFCARGQGADGARRVALTLDDGPSGAGSLELLDLLRQLQVPATLFLIGDHLNRGGEGFVARALADGHQIGNHMAQDSISARLPPEGFLNQLRRTEAALRGAAAPRSLALRWFRPGGGRFHRAMLESVSAEGYRLVLGSVFPYDTNQPPLWFLRRFLLANVHPGAIVVLHDRPDTIAATLHTLRAVVPELRRRGYRFVSLDQLG
ncbi:polysaccharide deacetylase family protein [Cyanobium sp. ATX 6A2]|uniref:polysaccharide deacetylase family protein n=1 Tax=Cyanobium sp. ATX 6A2 TaxID=2823700 RepID=UPI0020CD1D88|nr:polysaccharide deacetylase family protein [Cyanobium sp. ATX 6A2]